MYRKAGLQKADSEDFVGICSYSFFCYFRHSGTVLFLNRSASMATNLSISIRQRPSESDGGKLESGQETRLWDDFRNGDKSAYAFIYVRFFPILYNYGCRICRDKGLVQDCIQDLFVELSNPSSKLSSTTSIRFYLYRCIRRKIALRLSNVHMHRMEPLESHGGEALEDSAVLPIEFQQMELESTAERRLEILRALQFLTTKQRKVIQLRFYEDMSYEEISAKMCVSIKTAYNLVSMATTSLKSVIKRFPLLF